MVIRWKCKCRYDQSLGKIGCFKTLTLIWRYNLTERPLQQMNRLRSLSRISQQLFICPLSKKVLRLSGKDSVALLQGLTTNDMLLLNERKAGTGSSKQFHFPSLFTLLLSVEGRVLFDTIIHRGDEETIGILYLEADQNEIETLFQHLKKYKMRKKESSSWFAFYFCNYLQITCRCNI